MRLFVLLVALTSAVWGGIGACDNSTEFPSQPPSMSTIDSPGGSYTPGCSAVDKIFSGFTYNVLNNSYTSGTYLGWGSLPFTYVTAPFSMGTTASDTAVEFSSSYWYADAYSGYGGADAYANITFDYTVQSANTMNFASLTDSVSYAGYSTGAFVELFICPGATTFTAGCANEVSTYQPGSSVSFAPVTQLAVQMQIEYSAYAYNTTNSYVNVNWVENDFYDTPEPSTFFLSSAALGILFTLSNTLSKRTN